MSYERTQLHLFSFRISSLPSFTVVFIRGNKCSPASTTTNLWVSCTRMSSIRLSTNILSKLAELRISGVTLPVDLKQLPACSLLQDAIITSKTVYLRALRKHTAQNKRKNVFGLNFEYFCILFSSFYSQDT